MVRKLSKFALWLLLGTLAVGIAYALAYGPWIFFQYSVPIPNELVGRIDTYFAPMEQAAINGEPACLVDPYRAYLSWWSELAGIPLEY